MTWRRLLQRSLVVGVLLISLAQVTAILGAPTAAQEGGQTAPTATATSAAPVVTTGPTAVVPIHHAGGHKGKCTNGIGMGQSVCPMNPPTTGGGGTARVTVPARLPQTGGGRAGSSDDSVLLALALVLLAAGVGLACRARRTNALR